MITVRREGPNIAHSMFRWISDVQYTVGSQSGGIQDHFPDLEIRQAYPDDLTAIDRPVLAMSMNDLYSEGQEFFGYGDQETRHESFYGFNLYGFVVGQGSDEANLRYRDRLFNDVLQLLSVIASDAGVVLYDHVSETELGSLEVTEIRGRVIPANAPEFEVERYKFEVSGTIVCG